MKRISFIAMFCCTFGVWLGAAEPVECFTASRIVKEDVPWNKYYSPTFVSVPADDGTIKINVKRTAGGPVGGMFSYFIDLHQKTAAPIRISVESRASGFKGKAGYHYRISLLARYVGGGNSKEQYVFFPADPDGKWRLTEQTFDFERPVRQLYLSVVLCYRNGEAEFRKFSVKTDPDSLRPIPPSEKQQTVKSK